MKRTLFSICALAAVLVGCSKSDVVDAPNIDTPISFDVYSGKVPVSKATSIDGEDADDRQIALSGAGGFVVYAYNTVVSGEDYTPNWGSPYFDETLSYANGSWTFNVKAGNDKANVHYWPSDGNKLAFVAYSNNGGSDYVTPVEAGGVWSAPSLTVNVPNTVAEQKDVMVAKFVQTKSVNETPEPVSLSFHHVLSRVYFKLTSDRSMTVTSVKVNGDFYSTGNVDLYNEGSDSTTPAVEVETSDVESYEFLTHYFTLETETGTQTSLIIDNTPADTEEDETHDYYMMLIPSVPTTVEVIYYFEEDEDNKFIATATLNEPGASITDESFKFAAGKSYLFDLVLKSKAISFTATVEGWGTDQTIGSPTDENYKFVSERYTEEGGNTEGA